MPPLPLARNAAIVATAAAIVVLAGAVADLRFLVIAAALIAAGAGGFVAVSLHRSTPAEPPALVSKPEPDVPPASAGERAARKKTDATILLAALRNMSGSERLAGDLQRILAGIVADERGTIDSEEEQGFVASFARADHAAAAVQAARRMLSNVDALSRRLGHDFRIAIGVHTGPRGGETLAVAARIREASSDAAPVLVSEPAARHLGSALEQVDTIHGEGWSLAVFTFPPAQKRLPGL